SGPDQASTASGTLGRSGYTTHPSYPQSATATITLPGHPYRDQQVEVIRVGKGDDPDLLVRLPDGSYLVLAMRCTAYLDGRPPPASEPSPAPLDTGPLLHPDGLRRMAQFVARLLATPGSPQPAPPRTKAATSAARRADNP